jgi:hypothetical protein
MHPGGRHHLPAKALLKLFQTSLTLAGLRVQLHVVRDAEIKVDRVTCMGVSWSQGVQPQNQRPWATDTACTRSQSRGSGGGDTLVCLCHPSG